MRHGGAPTAGQFAIDAPFPGRISRSLEQAAGWVVAAVLLVGGTSLVLAARIFMNKEAVAREYRQILSHEQVHSVFDDLIFELQQTGATERLEPAADTARLRADLGRRLDAFEETHRGETSTSEPEREQAARATLPTCDSWN